MECKCARFIPLLERASHRPTERKNEDSPRHPKTDIHGITAFALSHPHPLRDRDEVDSMSTHLPQPPPDDNADFSLPPDDQPPRNPTGNDPPWDDRRSTRPDREPYDSRGVTAVVCGIVAVVLAMIPIMNLLTWPLGVLAIVFGAMGWNSADRDPTTNRNTSIIAIGLGVASIFITCGVYAGADPTNAPGVQGMLWHYGL